MQRRIALSVGQIPNPVSPPAESSVDSVFSVAMTENMCGMTNVAFYSVGNPLHWLLMWFMSLF